MYRIVPNPVTVKVQYLLEREEEDSHDNEENDEKYKHSPLVGAHEKPVAVELIAAGKMLPLALWHLLFAVQQIIYRHLVQYNKDTSKLRT